MYLVVFYKYCFVAFLNLRIGRGKIYYFRLKFELKIVCFVFILNILIPKLLVGYYY